MQTVPAMEAKLGSTTYYIISMKAKELADKVVIPREMAGWQDLSVEEIYQRDLNYSRVKSQIAPYLANDDSRFFGAIIVAAMNFEEAIQFEPLEKVSNARLPLAYKPGADKIGFLTFSGGEVLIPLDGQHRLKAIKFAVEGKDERGKNIPAIDTPCIELANEDVTVMLMAYEAKQARRIFTHVNKYAKATTTGQNIVTDDDDIVAVLTREIANEQIGPRLVKYTSNTLTKTDEHLTTMGIVYNCNEDIIKTNFPNGKIDKTRLPEKGKTKLYRDKVNEVWELLVEKIEVFSDMLMDTDPSGDKGRQEIRETNLLGRPVTQECLVKAFNRLTAAPTNLGAETACSNLNKLPWAIINENLSIWDRVLWAGGTDGKIITKRRALATRLISYLAGEKLNDESVAELLDEYRRQFPEGERAGKTLPDRIVS